MTANIKIILCVSVPVASENLEEGLARAKTLKVENILKFKPHVSHNDSKVTVTGVDTGEWTE